MGPEGTHRLLWDDNIVQLPGGLVGIEAPLNDVVSAAVIAELDLYEGAVTAVSNVVSKMGGSSDGAGGPAEPQADGTHQG